jgi:ATP-dependent Clp protease ATP-binding subunit ClpX
MNKPTIPMDRICSFCGKEYTPKEVSDFDVILFKSGYKDNIKICDECVEHCSKTLVELKADNMKPEVIKPEERITPSIIKAKLDEWIIDQEKAKYDVSIALYNHYKRLRNTDNKKSDIQIEKSNIMLVGPTGAGKTAIVKALATQLKLPYTIEDMTSITSSGYVGRDVADILKNLLIAAGGNLNLAQRGIVFLDEGDKLRRKATEASPQKDVNGEGVQQALLKMVEGGVFDLKKNDNSPGTIKFDTSNVLFIIGGAFEGIEKIIAKRLKKNDKDTTTLGFGAKIENKNQQTPYNDLIEQIKHEDLNAFGMTPELLGRFPVVTAVKELSEEALIAILTEPKNAIAKQYMQLFKMDDMELVFEDEAYKAIAKEAKARKIGARALRSIMEDVLSKPMFEAPSSDEKIVKVTITGDLKYQYEVEQDEVSEEI